MGNLFSYLSCCKEPNENIEFSQQLLEPLNDTYINTNFNRIYQNILNIERKIYLLEENTQKNLKLLSEDIHHIHNSDNRDTHDNRDTRDTHDNRDTRDTHDTRDNHDNYDNYDNYDNRNNYDNHDNYDNHVRDEFSISDEYTQNNELI